MKPFNYYETTTIPYPNKNDYTKYYVYNNGVVLWEGSYEEYKSKVDIPMPTDCVAQKVLDRESYKKHMNSYNAEYASLLEEFQNDLFEHFNVSNNSKRYKCYSIAWERGHAYGLNEVFNVFDELVELIID